MSLSKNQIINKLWENRSTGKNMEKICIRCNMDIYVDCNSIRIDSCKCTKKEFIKNITDDEITDYEIEQLALEKNILFDKKELLEKEINENNSKLSKLLTKSL